MRGALKADLVLVGITALWGATFVIVKDALGEADPFTFLAFRFAAGGAAALAFAFRHLRGPGRAALLRDGALLGLFLFLGYAFQTVGLQFTTESRSAFITGLAVILVPVVSLVLFKRVPALPSVVGVIIAFAGLNVLTGGLGEAEGEAVLKGDLLTLGCAVAFAAHISLTERYARGHPPFALVAVQLWVVALLSSACLPFVEVRVTWSLALLGAVLAAGLLASALAIGLQTWAQARTTAVRAALVFSLEPVFAASLSVALGRETLGARELLGGALMVAAILVAEVGGAVRARQKRAT